MLFRILFRVFLRRNLFGIFASFLLSLWCFLYLLTLFVLFLNGCKLCIELHSVLGYEFTLVLVWLCKHRILDSLRGKQMIIPSQRFIFERPKFLQLHKDTTNALSLNNNSLLFIDNWFLFPSFWICNKFRFLLVHIDSNSFIQLDQSVIIFLNNFFNEELEI